MNRIRTALILLLTASTLTAGEWIITIQGIESERQGELLLAVYPGEDGYMDDSAIVYGESMPVLSDTMQCIIKDLAHGEYSFAILHDEDGDLEMKMGVLMPKEGFAFSGSKQPAGKPPKYKKAYVTLDGTVVNSTAIMKYY